MIQAARVERLIMGLLGHTLSLKATISSLVMVSLLAMTGMRFTFL